MDPILGADGSLYMDRYELINFNNWTGIGARIHIIYRPDEDPFSHDHPWWNITWVLGGKYWEKVLRFRLGNLEKYRTHRRVKGSIVLRSPRMWHRIVDDSMCVATKLDEMRGVKLRRQFYEPAVTLFITGPYVHGWGFLVNGVKIPWRRYLVLRDEGKLVDTSVQQESA